MLYMYMFHEHAVKQQQKYLFERQREVEREYLLSASQLPRWQQQPGQGQAKATSMEPHPLFPVVNGKDQVLGLSSTASQANEQGLALKVE